MDRKNRCVTVHSLDRPESDSAGSSRRRSARLSKSLPPSGYPLYSETQKFYGATVVRANVLEELALTAENLLKPKRTPTEIIGSPVRKSQLERDDAKRERDDARNKVRMTKLERDDAKREKDDARNKEKEAKKKTKEAKRKTKETKNKNMHHIAFMKRRGIQIPAELEHGTDDSSGISGSSTASPERQRRKIKNRNLFFRLTLRK